MHNGSHSWNLHKSVSRDQDWQVTVMKLVVRTVFIVRSVDLCYFVSDCRLSFILFQSSKSWLGNSAKTSWKCHGNILVEVSMNLGVGKCYTIGHKHIVNLEKDLVWCHWKNNLVNYWITFKLTTNLMLTVHADNKYIYDKGANCNEWERTGARDVYCTCRSQLQIDISGIAF